MNRSSIFWTLAFVAFGLTALFLVRGWRQAGSIEQRPTRRNENAATVHDAETDALIAASERTRAISEEPGSFVAQFFVVDRERQPIEAAALNTAQPGTRRALGKTDKNGQCQTAVTPGDSLEVVADGYHPATLAIPQERLTSEWTVVLEGRHQVRGIVTWSTGDPLGAEVDVFAWPTGYSPELDELLKLAVDSPGERTLRTATDRNGRFSMTLPLSPKYYSFTASGATGICLNRAMCLSTAETCIVPMLPVYGIAIHLRDDGGSVLKCSPRLFSRGASWDVLDKRLTAMLARPVELEWLLRADPQAVTGYGQFDQLLVFTASEKREVGRDDVAGPVEYTVEVPGYEKSSTSLFPSMAPTFPETTLTLKRQVNEWGSVICRIVPQNGNQRCDDKRAFGLVKFRDRDPTAGRQYSALVTGQETLIQGVPCGSYGVLLQAGDWYFSWPGENDTRDITVLPDATVELSIPIEGVGYVSLDLLRATGGQYGGSAVVEIRGMVGSKSVAKFVAFDRSPYFLGPLPMGEYEILVDSIPGRRGLSIEQTSVVLREPSIVPAGILISQ